MTLSVWLTMLKCLLLPSGTTETTLLNSRKSLERDLYFFASRLHSFENSGNSLKFIIVISDGIALVAVENAFIRKRLTVLGDFPWNIFVRIIFYFFGVFIGKTRQNIINMFYFARRKRVKIWTLARQIFLLLILKISAFYRFNFSFFLHVGENSSHFF